MIQTIYVTDGEGIYATAVTTTNERQEITRPFVRGQVTRLMVRD